MSSSSLNYIKPCHSGENRNPVGQTFLSVNYKEIKINIEYDKQVDALYIRIQEVKVARTEELEEGVNLDFDTNGKLIGLEILNALERYQPEDLFKVSSEALAMTEPV